MDKKKRGPRRKAEAIKLNKPATFYVNEHEMLQIDIQAGRNGLTRAGFLRKVYNAGLEAQSESA